MVQQVGGGDEGRAERGAVTADRHHGVSEPKSSRISCERMKVKK